jgi:hypothetical protein
MSAIFDLSAARTEQIAAELARCRQRGLERIDRDDQRQRPVLAAELETLAGQYTSRLRITATGRTAQIKVLLAAALQAYGASGNTDDANLIRGLLFSDSTLIVRKSAGVLLRETRQRFGEPSEALFREQFKTAFSRFAAYLVQFVGDTADGREPSPDGAQSGRGSLMQVLAGPVGDKPVRFTELLADAAEVTIVGFDNELLEASLREGLELKRARRGDPLAFWRSLEIVFLSESLLDYIDDHAVSPDRRVAVRERRRTMTETKRSVRLLLRKSGGTDWSVSDLPFLPGFAGSLFVLPDARHVVQLIVRQPASRTRTADQVYLEFDDLPNEYFTKAFRRVVDRSITDNRPVPVGNPFGGTFVSNETKYRLEVLKPESGSQNWLPMVIVVTTQRRRGQIWPVLQLRTEEIAVRETDTVSHPSRHIYQDEASPLAGARAVSAPPSFDVNSECARRAAQLRVQSETGDDVPPDLKELGTGQYVNPDTESLFFFVYSLELPEETKFPPKSEMHHFTLPELLAIRAHQALRISQQLLEQADRPARYWKTAVELATLNLALHGHDDLGRSLDRLADAPAAELRPVLKKITELIEATAPTCASSGRELRIVGLSGWQYREFFSVLLPQYAKAGVPGAAEELRRTSAGPLQGMLRRVASLYQDEDLLRSLPIEL